MEKIIIKNLLEKIGEDGLPTTKKQFQRLYYSPHVTLGLALLLLDEYEEYSDMWMECFSVILDNTDFDTYSHTILNDLLEKITSDFENKKLSSENYYTIIKQICDSYNICRNINMYYLLSIIDKCDDKFIKDSLSKSISSKYIGYYALDKYHHLIDWKIFQENNDICEIIEKAADNCDNEDYEDIINCLTTKDYLINNLDYDYVMSKGVNNYTTIFSDDELLIKLLSDYKKYNISFNTLCLFCKNHFMSNDLINFICTRYKPDNKLWDTNKKARFLRIIYYNTTKERCVKIIKEYKNFFLKDDEIRSYLKKMFKWNWKMQYFIRKF